MLERVEQLVRLVLEVVGEAPVGLPGELPGLGVGVGDAPLDGLLQKRHVALKAVPVPRV